MDSKEIRCNECNGSGLVQVGDSDHVNSCEVCEGLGYTDGPVVKFTFGDVQIGECFEWMGTIYKKIAYDILPRYGHVNMVGPSFYAGDTGHRFLMDDRTVERM